VDGRVGVGVKHRLGDAFTVPQVDEDHPAQVAAAMHPAHHQGAGAGVGGPQLAAGVRAA
jgi:hypothetical protein